MGSKFYFGELNKMMDDTVSSNIKFPHTSLSFLRTGSNFIPKNEIRVKGPIKFLKFGSLKQGLTLKPAATSDDIEKLSYNEYNYLRNDLECV